MTVTDQIKITEASLRVYYFAPRGSFRNKMLSERNLGFFQKVWLACDDSGIKDPISDLNLPTEIPSLTEISEETTFRPIAAKINREKKLNENLSQQALIFNHADYLGLIITFEVTVGITDVVEWNRLFEEFGNRLPKPSDSDIEIDYFHLYSGILLRDSNIIQDENKNDNAETRIFEISNSQRQRRRNVVISQIVEKKDTDLKPLMEINAAKEIFCALPPTSADTGEENFFPSILLNGWRLWEKKIENRGTSLALLTKETTGNVSDKLFNWSTFVSKTQIPLFVGYLLYLSKSKSAFRKFWQVRDQIKKEKEIADGILQSLVYLNENLVKYNINVNLAEHIEIENELLTAQTKSYDLLFSLSRLRDLSRTVEIARKNMESFIPLESAKPISQFFFGNDKDASLLVEQINFDIGYLESFQERSAEGYNLTRLLQEQESKEIAKRLNKLILLHGSLLGAIGIGLAALQSFGVKPPLKDSLFLLLSLFLAALALCLPTLVTHWEDGYDYRDHIIGGIITSALFVLIKAVGDEYFPIITIPYTVWIISFFLTSILGFCIGRQVTKYFSKRRKENQVSNLGIPLDNTKLNAWTLKFLEEIGDNENQSLLSTDSHMQISLLADEFRKEVSVLKKYELLNKVHELKSGKSLTK